jgi:hypothetical protein
MPSGTVADRHAHACSAISATTPIITVNGGHPMRTLGKLLVIWGTLFPLITLPSIGNGSYRYMPFFDTHFGPLHMDYDTVLQTALFMVGIGPSLWVMPRGLLSPIPQSPSPLSGVPGRSSL